MSEGAVAAAAESSAPAAAPSPLRLAVPSANGGEGGSPAASTTPRSELSESATNPLSARSKKWIRPVVQEDVADVPDMASGPKKLKKGVAWDKNLTKEELSAKTQQADTVLQALGTMKTADLSKFTATEGDEDALNRADAAMFRGKHLVNILSLNGSDKDIDYGEIFGDGLDEVAGMRVWACENWKLKVIDESDYGHFHTQDCYIVLHISDPSRTKAKSIHIWVGRDATQDKMATAAIRSIMLNTYLSSQCRMHREEQGRESESFLAYFYRFNDKVQLQLHDGSLCTGGFKRPDAFVHQPVMYLVQPSAAARLKQVDRCRGVLDEAHTFILDDGMTVYQWNGRKSPRAVRFKAMEMMRNMNDFQRNCNARLLMLEQGVDDVNCAEFWALLPESPPPQMSLQFEVHPRLFQTYINDQGKPNVQPIEPPFRRQKVLDSAHCLIMDAFSELFVWIGRYASSVEKKVAQLLAQRLSQHKAGAAASSGSSSGDARPSWVAVTQVRDGAEPVSFRHKFADWYDVLPLRDYSKPPPRKLPPSLRNLKQPPIDVEALFNAAPPEERSPPDDGSGVIEIWNLERAGPKFVKIPLTERAHFYSGDCYLVLYTYNDERAFGVQRYIAYFWEGRFADSKWYPSFLFGFYPLLQKKMASKGQNNRLTQQRVFESKEPAHFMSLFKGRMVIHRGNRRTNKASEDEKVQLFDVKAVSESRVHAIEVEAFPEYLHSRDCFVLLTPQKVFLWNGYCSRATSRDAAERIANELLIGGRDDPVSLDEDLEDDAFWDVLGPKATDKSPPYANAEFYKKYELNECRLFLCTTRTGVLAVEEVHGFTQADFNDDACFWLDAHTELYVWYGSRTFGGLRLLAHEHAQRYAKYAAQERGKDALEVVEVYSGAEPREFKWQFHAWTDPRPFQDPREPRLKALMQDLLEDRQLEELERNLSREERCDTRTGEFDYRLMIDTEFALKNELVDCERGADGRWRLDVVLIPGLHCYEVLIDGEVQPPLSDHPTVDHEGRQLYRLRINSRGLFPTVYTFRLPFDLPVERPVRRRKIKVRKKVLKEKIRKKTRPPAEGGAGSGGGAAAAAAASVVTTAGGGSNEVIDEQKDSSSSASSSASSAAAAASSADDGNQQVEYTIVEREVLIAADETAEEKERREAAEKRWKEAQRVQLRGSFTSKQVLKTFLQMNPQMKLLGPQS